jgi:uncharacterized protein (TIGR02001 family)
LRHLARIVPALALAALAAPAFAQDEPDNWSVTFGAATDYRSKGASKTLGDPYAFGEVEWRTDDERFYVAAAVAHVKQSIGAEGEADLTIGFRPEAAGFSFDLNAMYRVYPDADSGTDDDYWEFTADASRSVGPVSGRLRVQYSPDNAGGSHAFTWYEARAGYKITPKLRATAAIGRRETEDSLDYTAWNLGVTWRLQDRLNVDLRYYDTDREAFGPQYEDAVVGALTFDF